MQNIFNARYLKIADKLGIPLTSGISGTTDQSITMAGLVGLALDEQSIMDVRLAYIAFMLPNNDHSLIEILQSSSTFGMDFNVALNMASKNL